MNLPGTPNTTARWLVFTAVAAFVTLATGPLLTGPGQQTLLLVNIASLACFILAIRLTPLGDNLARQFTALAAFLERRGAFRSNAVAEQPKFALIRIAFGIILTIRASYILYYLYPSDWHDPSIVAAAISNFIVAPMVLFGLFTQVALAFLMLIQWHTGDLILSTATLGNNIGCAFAMLLIFANSGARFSVDAWIVARNGRLARAVRATYFGNGLPSDKTLQVAKFATLLCYWLVCVYSLSMHLSESAWMTGTAGPHLLANNFMSRFSDEFERFLQISPLAVLATKIGLWGMLPWYAFIVPFVVAGGWLRRYVLIWAALFFALSIFVLQLGWLGEIECLFFAGLFWERRFLLGEDRLDVAYDDRCNLCDRTVQFIKAVDVFGQVRLRPASQNEDWLKGHGISMADAMHDLYGVDASGRPSHGYDFYVALCGRVFLLVPLLPMLWLGKWTGIGPRLYRFIADRRTRLFGVCQIPSPKIEHVARKRGIGEGSSILTRNDATVVIASHIVFLACFYVFAIPAPFLNWQGVPFPEPVREVTAVLADAAHVYGMAPINVFNRTDLRMSENWFTLDAVDAKGVEKILPLLGKRGGRLAMHKSDRVYFGFTLRARRAAIGIDGCLFDRLRADLMRVASFKMDEQTKTFRFRQYHQKLAPEDELLDGRYIVPPTSLVCEQDFQLPPKP